MARIWKTEVAALQEGWNLREFQTRIREQMIKYTGHVFGRDMTGEDMLGSHVELIYRNAMMQSFSDGKDALANDPDLADTVWGFQYRIIKDDRVREDHEKLHEITLPKDHEFWKRFTPPIFHNCRCDRRMITFRQIAQGLFTQTPESEIPDLSSIETFH